jgi:hypothetical protein
MNADQALKDLEAEQAELINALDSVAYGDTRANIRERLQRIERELDEIYAFTAEEGE